MLKILKCMAETYIKKSAIKSINSATNMDTGNSFRTAELVECSKFGPLKLYCSIRVR